MLYVHAMWGWLQDDQDIHPLNRPVPQVVVKAAVGAPFPRAP